jgi:uncharacterized membrane protein YeaQ/YmgE (transglycosylase-associated protein family)
MGLLLAILVVVLLLGVGMWLTVGLIGLALTLLVAGLVGWAADAVIPGRHPGGWLGAILTGIAGGFLGHLVFSVLHLPALLPAIAGIQVVPAFVGAVIILLAMRALSGSNSLAARY